MFKLFPIAVLGFLVVGCETTQFFVEETDTSCKAIGALFDPSVKNADVNLDVCASFEYEGTNCTVTAKSKDCPDAN